MFFKKSILVFLTISVFSFLSCGGGDDDGMLLFLPPGGEEETANEAGGPGSSPEETPEGNEESEGGSEVTTESTGGDTGTTTGDTGTTTGDTGTTTGDTGSTTGDTGTTTGDTGTTTGDTGTTTGDTGTTTGDTGTTTGDTGSTTGDTGSTTGNTNSDDENDDSDDGTVAIGENDDVDNSDNDDLDDDKYGEDDDKDDDSEEELADGSHDDSSCVQSIKLDTKKGRWFKSTDNNDDAVSGIHTYWRNQALKVRIKLNKDCKHQKWAKLTVVAKNIAGPLPDFYKNFNVEVRRGDRKKIIGAMKVPASDLQYKEGSIYVRVRKSNTFWLYWQNDAWKRGVYDANINIKKVKFELISKKLKEDSRRKLNADKNCFTKGRFFFDNHTARTYWRNQTIGYCFNDLEPGVYEIKVQAKNYGRTGLPPGYEEFNVTVASDGVIDTMAIDASEDDYKSGSAVLDLRGGDTIVNLTWTNDKYKKGKYDANIMYREIELKRVGESQRSGLAAYIGQNSSSLVILLSLIVALASLGMIMLYRKRMESMS